MSQVSDKPHPPIGPEISMDDDGAFLERTRALFKQIPERTWAAHVAEDEENAEKNGTPAGGAASTGVEVSSKPSRASSDPKLAQQRRKRLARTERQAIEGVQAMAEYIAAAQASIDRIPQLRAARLARAEKERNKGCVRLDKGQRPQLPPPLGIKVRRDHCAQVETRTAAAGRAVASR